MVVSLVMSAAYCISDANGTVEDMIPKISLDTRCKESEIKINCMKSDVKTITVGF